MFLKTQRQTEKMAIWHYQFHVFPTGGLPPYVMASGIYSEHSWKNCDPINWSFVVKGYLKPEVSWSDSVNVWGSEECVQLYVVKRGKEVLSVFVRIHFDSDYEDVLAKLLQQFKIARLSLYFSNREVSESLLEEVIERIRTFDPYKTFRNMS